MNKILATMALTILLTIPSIADAEEIYMEGAMRDAIIQDKMTYENGMIEGEKPTYSDTDLEIFDAKSVDDDDITILDEDDDIYDLGGNARMIGDSDDVNIIVID